VRVSNLHGNAPNTSPPRHERRNVTVTEKFASAQIGKTNLHIFRAEKFQTSSAAAPLPIYVDVSLRA
jgi:hypothetical protein